MRGPDPTAPKNNSPIKLRTACKPVKEVSLGTTGQLAALQSLDLTALQKLTTAQDSEGNDVVEIQSDVVKFRSPLLDPTGARISVREARSMSPNAALPR